MSKKPGNLSLKRKGKNLNKLGWLNVGILFLEVVKNNKFTNL
jgi:hypothetical protein